MTTEVKKLSQKSEMTVGGEGAKWLMRHIDSNFVQTFKSEGDAKRFKTGLAAEIIRNPQLQNLLHSDPLARRSFLVTLLTCILDGQVPGVHTIFQVRQIRGRDTICRDDKLEGSLALLEHNGYRPCRPILVYEGDTFTQSRSIVDGVHRSKLEHIPCGIDDPEKITGGYIILEHIESGVTDWSYTPRHVFDTHRDKVLSRIQSDKQKWSPWRGNFGEMCQKTVAKRSVRYLNKVPLMATQDTAAHEVAANIISDTNLTEEERGVLQEQYTRNAYSDEGSLPEVEEDATVLAPGQGATVEGDVLPLEKTQEVLPKKRGRPKKNPEPVPEPQPEPEPEPQPKEEVDDIIGDAELP